MEVEICVGSSCHLKGSHQVVEVMEKYINDNGLSDEIQLKGSFCLGHCTTGVSAKIDGKVVSLSLENAEDVLNKHWEGRQNAAD